MVPGRLRIPPEARAGRPIGFMAFLRIGVPVTLASMLLATGYIAVRYL